VEIEEGSCGRHFLFSHVIDVLNRIETSKVDYNNNDMEVGLLIPGYMNGSDFYQFCRVKEIWLSRSNNIQKFVMSDGSMFYFPPNEGVREDNNMELVMNA